MIGVIEPGARAACEASASGRIAVFATEGTVRGGAYQRAILALRPDAHVTQIAVPGIRRARRRGLERGRCVDAVAERYLAHLDARVDTVVLGCTHFPLLARRDRKATRVRPRRVVDSAATTARATALELASAASSMSASACRQVRLMATDSPERFARVGARFLGSSIAEKAVEAIDL